MPGLPQVALSARRSLRLACLRAARWSGIAFALCAAAASAGAAFAASPPNLLLITVDTLRADALGFAGNAEVETPTIDRLAKAGRVFPFAHAHNVVTLPSHANLLTGLLPFEHGVRDNSGYRLPERLPTLATWLKEAGYATGAFVAAYVLDSRYGLARGFDLYDDRYPRGGDPASFVIAERRGDEVVAAALEWWRGQPAGAKKFLWLHLYDPHAAYDPPEPFRSRYRERPYLGEVAAVDSFLKPLLEPFLAGREAPALVVFTSDHGEALGEHGEETHGLFCYEATLRVPLVLWGESVEAGVDARSARHLDIAPTLLAAAGRRPPRELAGRSLLGPPPAEPVESYFEALTTALNRGWAPLRGLLSGRTKLIDLPLAELYDLASDPGEQRNRVADERRTAARLRQALPAASAWPPAPRGEVSQEEAAKLASLGYLVGSAALRTRFGPEDDPKNLIAVDRQIHQLIDRYSRGDFAAAVAIGRAIVAARPTMPDGYDHLALALRQLERHDEAIAALREGAAKAGRNERLQRQLGLALAEVGKSAEAVRELEPFASAGEPETLRALGVAWSDLGEQAKAQAVLERAEAVTPKDPLVQEALGLVELRRGSPAAAAARLRRAIAGNERLATAWNSLGVALYRSEGPAAAIAAWRRAVELEPKLFDALFNLGLVALEAGRRDEAERALARFVAEAPPSRFAADLGKARALLAQLQR